MLMLLGGIAGMFTVFDEIADVARVGSKLLDNGDEVIDVLRASKGLDNIDNVADVGRSLDNVAELAEVGRGLDHIDEVTDIGRSLDNLDDLMDERRVFSQARTRAAFFGGSDGALSNRLNSQCNSFTAGTPVQTEAGQKLIEEIKVGNKVLAEDPATDEQGYFEVVALTNHHTDEILKVTLDASAEGSD